MLCSCAAGGDLERPVDYAQFMQGIMKMIRKNVFRAPEARDIPLLNDRIIHLDLKHV